MAQSPVLGAVSPQAILDLYLSLNDEQQCETLRLIARHSTAEAPILMTSELSPSECERYAAKMFETFRRLQYCGGQLSTVVPVPPKTWKFRA